MVSDAISHAHLVSSTTASSPVRVGDEEFCRRAMRDGLERLGVSLDELLRRASSQSDAA